jgi:general stress protein 26
MAIVWDKSTASPQIDPAHIQRIQDELRRAGVTMYGLAKFSSQYLHHIIHNDERIWGVVYGRYRSGEGLLKFTEGMLIATDRRVIFLDYKPGFTSVEEITYTAISGISFVTTGLFSSVTLYTRIGNFILNYANSSCVQRFVSYVESRQIEQKQPEVVRIRPEKESDVALPIQAPPDALAFLCGHGLAVISTVSSMGKLHGAVVYYLVDTTNNLYILTKSETQKSQNICATHQVALTIYDATSLQTAQIHGTAEPENRQSIRYWAFRALLNHFTEYNGQGVSPVAAFHTGSFVVFRVKPDSIHFTDYSKHVSTSTD